MPRKKSATAVRTRICFVTGSRAEFGLMGRVLHAIQNHPGLSLQIVVTGMHLDRKRGMSINDIRSDGWAIDAVAPWRAGANLAFSTGHAIATLSKTFAALQPHIVIVVGDRVEAFAAATAAHLNGIFVAHVHGGDRALGQVDDALRHAITKLAHLHFPATAQSAQRLAKLGEDAWRIHRVGSPGIDGIASEAAPRARLAGQFPRLLPRDYILLSLHPVDTDESVEYSRAGLVLNALKKAARQIVIVYPNNDPGSAGIIQRWEQCAGDGYISIHKNLPRPVFLGLMRDAALLVGNSSSGIIEAGSFGTPVIDIGPRQAGRERNPSVSHVPYQAGAIRRAIAVALQSKHRRANLYQGKQTALRIADILAKTPMTPALHRKLIAY